MLLLLAVTVGIYLDVLVDLSSFCQDISRKLLLVFVLKLDIFLEYCGCSLFLLSRYF